MGKAFGDGRKREMLPR